MIKEGFTFEFEVPDNWKESLDRTQLIFTGSNNEQLIVSGWRIEGVGTESERSSVREKLFHNAVQSVQSAADHPELIVKSSLQRDNKRTEIETWHLAAETRKGNIKFCESIFVSESGVLLVTFEGPNSVESDVIFNRFIKTVRPVAVIENQKTYLSEFSVTQPHCYYLKHFDGLCKKSGRIVCLMLPVSWLLFQPML